MSPTSSGEDDSAASRTGYLLNSILRARGDTMLVYVPLAPEITRQRTMPQ